MDSRAGATTDDIRSLLAAVMSLMPADGPGDRVDRLRLLEEVKAACAAAQAVEAAGLDRERRQEHAAAGLPPAKQGMGVAGEVALAMRTSPYRGQRFVGWAKILTAELPATFCELRAGRTTEWRAMLFARETAVLSQADRRRVDRELAPKLEGWGDRQVEHETRRAAQRLDPAAAVARARSAEADRRLTIRPAPDTMVRLTALLPVAQGVACYAALSRAADSAAAAGDPRGRGQVMADTFVRRVTGQATADAVPVEINLVLTADALFGTGPGSDEPALISGYGPVSAPAARELALSDAPRWIRRLFTAPRTGELVALESRRRYFTAGQKRFLHLRDQTCRTPWCDAPVRHADHVRPYADGGATTVGNGQALSETCNQQKQAPGWSTRAGPDGTVTTRTPTGHEYASRPPDLPEVSVRPLRGHVVWHDLHRAA